MKQARRASREQTTPNCGRSGRFRKGRGKLAAALLCLFSLAAVGCLRADVSIVVDDSDVDLGIRMTAAPFLADSAVDGLWDSVLEDSELFLNEGFSDFQVEEVSDPDGWTGVFARVKVPTAGMLTETIYRSPTDRPQIKRTATGWHFYWQPSDSMDSMGMNDSFGDFNPRNRGDDYSGKDIEPSHEGKAIEPGKGIGPSHEGNIPWKSSEPFGKGFGVPDKDCDCPRKGFGPRGDFGSFWKDDFSKEDYESFWKEFGESSWKDFETPRNFEDYSWDDFASFWEEFAPRFGDTEPSSEGSDLSWEDFISLWEGFTSGLGESGLSVEDFGFLQEGVDLSLEDFLPLLEDLAPLLEDFDLFKNSEGSLSNEDRNDSAWRNTDYARNESDASRRNLLLAMEDEDWHAGDSGEDSDVFDMDDWGWDDWDWSDWGLDLRDLESSLRYSVTLPGQLVESSSDDVTFDGDNSTAWWSFDLTDSNVVLELTTTAETEDSRDRLGVSWILVIIFSGLGFIALVTFLLARNRRNKVEQPEEPEDDSPDEDPPDSPDDGDPDDSPADEDSQDSSEDDDPQDSSEDDSPDDDNPPDSPSDDSSSPDSDSEDSPAASDDSSSDDAASGDSLTP